MVLNTFAHRTGRSLLFLIVILSLFTASADLAEADPLKKTTSSSAASSSGPTFSLSAFNPAADGVTDDGPAFQQALNAVAQAGGGTLFVPAGKYFIATPV